VFEAQIRREEEKREEARQLKESLEQQMVELKEREVEVQSAVCIRPTKASKTNVPFNFSSLLSRLSFLSHYFPSRC